MTDKNEELTTLDMYFYNLGDEDREKAGLAMLDLFQNGYNHYNIHQNDNHSEVYRYFDCTKCKCTCKHNVEHRACLRGTTEKSVNIVRYWMLINQKAMLERADHAEISTFLIQVKHDLLRKGLDKMDRTQITVTKSKRI